MSYESTFVRCLLFKKEEFELSNSSNIFIIRDPLSNRTSAFCPSLDGAITVFCDMNYLQIIFERRIIIMSNASRYKALFNVRIIRDEVLESSTSPVGNLRFRHGTWGTPLTYVIIYKMEISNVAMWSQEGLCGKG